MFTGFTEETIRFFLDLKFHNNSAYFHENHDRYVEEVQHVFYDMIDALAPDMLKIDPQMEVRPHKCLSRIHRDTRFSRDKSPYRDHLWFLFRKSAEPREKSLFFYGEFGPGRLDWGMGIWGENRELMDAFRRKTAAFPDRMSALISGLTEKMQRLSAPADAPADKALYALRDVTGTVEDEKPITGTAVIDEMRADFLALAPLYRLFRGLRDEMESSEIQGENK